MDDISVFYKGEKIGVLNSTGKLVLKTDGLFCKDNILIDYNSPSNIEIININYGNDGNDYYSVIFFDPCKYDELIPGYLDFSQYYIDNGQFETIYYSDILFSEDSRFNYKLVSTKASDTTSEQGIRLYREDTVTDISPITIGCWFNLKADPTISQVDDLLTISFARSLGYYFSIYRSFTDDEIVLGVHDKDDILDNTNFEIVRTNLKINSLLLEDNWHYISLTFDPKSGSMSFNVFVDFELYMTVNFDSCCYPIKGISFGGHSSSMIHGISRPVVVDGAQNKESMIRLSNYSDADGILSFGIDDLSFMEESYFLAKEGVYG